jgi:hypothetical protein
VGVVSAIPAKVRNAVLKRAQGHCEACGEEKPLELHHRKYRSRGGIHSFGNIVALCGGPAGLPGGNHSGCHGDAHNDRGPEGVSLHSWDVHEHEPFQHHRLGRVLLLDDGQVITGSAVF